MPVYQYKARDKFGSLFVGTIESSRKETVAEQLDRLGYIPVRIEEQRTNIFTEFFFDRFQKITLQDMIVFTRQMATLISAGLPFTMSFDALIGQADNRRLRGVLSKVKMKVEGGSTLADAMAKHPKVFSELYVNMIRAGEVSGMLDEILFRLAGLLEHEAETRARVKAAIRYPVIVIVTLCAAFLILMAFVIPRFAAIYANFRAQLPLPTRIMIAINHIATNYWYLIIGPIIIAIVGLKKYIDTEPGRLWRDGLKIRLPIFGPIFLKIAMSRFARIFGTLIKSGLPILQTLDIVSTTIGNTVISRVVDNIRDSAREGSGISEPMRVSKIFPPIVVQMVAIGEETGNMEQMLIKVSDYYDMEVEYAIRNLSTAIEPLLLLIIGGAVLLLALAIFMPWWNLMSLFKH